MSTRHAIHAVSDAAASAGRTDVPRGEGELLRPPSGPVTLKTVQLLLTPFNDRYGPTIDLHQAAELGGYEPATVYRLVSQGFFARSVSRRRPLLFLRDVFVWERMNIGASRAARDRASKRRGGKTASTGEQAGGADRGKQPEGGQ